MRQNIEIKNCPCNTGKRVIDSVTSLFKIYFFCSQIRTYSASCFYVGKENPPVSMYVCTYPPVTVCLFIYVSMYLYVCMLIYYIDSSPSFLFPVLFLFIHYSADNLLMHFKSNGFVRCLVVFTFIDYAFLKTGEIIQIHSRHNHPRTIFGSGALNFWRALALSNRIYRRHSHMTFIGTKTSHIIWQAGLDTYSIETRIKDSVRYQVR